MYIHLTKIIIVNELQDTCFFICWGTSDCGFVLDRLDPQQRNSDCALLETIHWYLCVSSYWSMYAFSVSLDLYFYFLNASMVSAILSSLLYICNRNGMWNLSCRIRSWMVDSSSLIAHSEHECDYYNFFLFWYCQNSVFFFEGQATFENHQRSFAA